MQLGSIKYQLAGKIGARNSHKLLVADDNDLYRRALETYFSSMGFQVKGFDAGAEFLSQVLNSDPVDLLILDWEMSDIDGLEILERIREEGLEVPVIFLTERSDPVFEETALLVGAVDFVDKSRGFSILYRRVQLVLNGVKFSSGSDLSCEAGKDAEDPYDDSGLHFDIATSRVQWEGVRVRLSASEVKVVHHLVENNDRFIGHREIYDLIKGQNFSAGTGSDGYRTNVRSFLKRVRQKFREVDTRFDEIKTYPGLGYRWCGESTGINAAKDDATLGPCGPCRPEPVEAPCAPS